MLQLQQKQKKELADQERHQERHLLRQIDKIATLMANDGSGAGPHTSTKAGAVKFAEDAPSRVDAAGVGVLVGAPQTISPSTEAAAEAGIDARYHGEAL